MHVQVCRHRYIYGVEELAEFHRTVAPLALPDNLSRLSFEGSEQGRGAMSEIVMSRPLNLARPHGQERAGTVQGLNLRFLIDTQDHGSVWRAEVEPNDVTHLLNEQGITGELERFRAKMLQAGIVVFALGSLAAAFSSTGGQLIAWRTVMGVGGSMMLPATLAIITNTFLAEERAKAIGVWAGINGIGIALGPIVGGLILNDLNWNWIFLVNLPVAAIALVMGWFLIPDSRDPNPKRLDIPGTLLSASALGSLVYGLINGSVRGWTDPWVLGTLAVAAVLGTLFVLWERHTSQPMLEIGFFKNPRFSAGVLSVSIMALALIGINYSLTLYMQFVNGYTPLQAGVRFAPVAVGILFGAGSAGRLVSSLGTKRVMLSGFAGTIAMVILASFWQVNTPYWQLGLIFFGFGFFLGYIAAPAADAIMGAVPKARAGVGSAMNSVTRMVAGSIGVAALGSVLNDIYASSFDKAAVGQRLPPEVAALARDSVGAAVTVAGRLPAEVGNSLVQMARQSFMDGFHSMAIISCVICAVGALVVLKTMPHNAAGESTAETSGKSTG